jgi:hypothetical protein
MMHFFTTEGVGVAFGLVLQAALLFVMFHRSLAKIYPILTIYLLVNLLEDPLGLLVSNHTSQWGYAHFYIAATILDSLLQLLIIFEVGWNVIRPSRTSIPLPVMPVALVGFFASAVIAASFSPQIDSIGISHLSQIFVRFTFGLAVMKLVLFLALAGFAQILGIGWKNHVLQLATGLAFYAAISLIIQISISHLSNSDSASYMTQYNRLTGFQSAAYNLTLIFWIWAFSRNEAPRKDFTPQMQEVLVTIAEAAKRTRLVVTRSTDRR